MTSLVNIKSKKPYDVYCGRANKHYKVKESLFANPFVIGKDGTRVEVVNKYREYFYNRIVYDKHFYESVMALEDKTLACWCDEDQPCHVRDVIIDYLDEGF